ncbi:MAG: glycosyltransferase family 39 protein [Minisyncoccota bacterium]
MTHKIFEWFKAHEKVTLFLLVFIFISIRLPGTNLPLHQDEYKWPKIVNPALKSHTEIPHPPLSQFIYREAGRITGYNVHFRFVPLFFGTLNLLLLYYFLQLRFGRQTAFVGGVLFTLSYFSVLASLMVDTDGQIIPFFFLTGLIAYEKTRLSFGRVRLWWIGAMFIFFVLGFFVKVSFILAIGAICADFLWRKKRSITKKEILKYGAIGFGFIGGLVLLLFIAQTVFSFFNLSVAVEYWEHFIQSDRNWFQTGIQVVKVLLFTSPFLISLPFFISREKRQELMPFLFYITFGLIFYIVLFDFSIGALDRYLQYLIVPLCALSSVAIASIWKSDKNNRNKEFLFLGTIFALKLLYLSGLHHEVPSLHPKSEWLSRVMSFKWNFLYPFSGGSGPLGFYMSFLFLGLSWITTILLSVLAYFKTNLRKKILLILLPIALMYNGLFIEEYVFGNMYGSAPRLLSSVVEFIKNNPDIEHVTVYNDNGGNEIQEIGKYRKRLYTDPAFDINEKIDTLNKYKEHYLEINVPRIDPSSVYRRYLDSCEVVYKETDEYISATVYDCRKVVDIQK